MKKQTVPKVKDTIQLKAGAVYGCYTVSTGNSIRYRGYIRYTCKCNCERPVKKVLRSVLLSNPIGCGKCAPVSLAAQKVASKLPPIGTRFGGWSLLGHEPNPPRPGLHVQVECVGCKKMHVFSLSHLQGDPSGGCHNCVLRSSLGTTHTYSHGYAERKVTLEEAKRYALACKVSGKQETAWVSEHRLVMSQILGRALAANEQVHHRNGVKSDNQPENLQLMLINDHPAGATLADTLAWAKRIINEYDGITETVR